MAEKPAEAVRAKPDSSLVSAVRAVAAGDADAVVSAGNTGAMLAAGLLHLRRLPGVLRPAIAIPMPTRNGVSLLLDAGANADCRPEHLVQFAVMGSVFSQEMLDVAHPQVRLLSIGEEPEKGNQLTIEAHELLADGRRDRVRRKRRGPRAPSRRRRCRRHRRLHRQRRAEAARGRDQGAPRSSARGDRVDHPRQGRRPVDQARRAPAPHQARPRHLRRRLPARPERPGGDLRTETRAAARSRTRSSSPLAAPITGLSSGSPSACRNGSVRHPQAGSAPLCRIGALRNPSNQNRSMR